MKPDTDTNTYTDTNTVIPVSCADLRGNESRYVQDCIARGWLTQGPYVERFEAELARVTGAKYALACSSGTAALHLAMQIEGMSVTQNATVIVPSLTYVATANAAKYCCAHVRFADVDRESWCVTPATLQKTLDWLVEDRHPKACNAHCTRVAAVHLYDAVCDIESFDPLTRDVLIVDSSHSTATGTWWRAATLSFYASKTIACGEGGALLLRELKAFAMARSLRGQGATSRRYYHDEIGYNYRMTDLQAAVGLAQLERLDEMLAARRHAYNLYLEILTARGFLSRGGEFQGGARSSAWTFACLLPADVDRDSVMSRLLETHNVDTRPFFVPLNELPMYRDVSGPPTPVAAEVSRRGICLPLFSGITDQQVDRVCASLMVEVSR